MNVIRHHCSFVVEETRRRKFHTVPIDGILKTTLGIAILYDSMGIVHIMFNDRLWIHKSFDSYKWASISHSWRV